MTKSAAVKPRWREIHKDELHKIWDKAEFDPANTETDYIDGCFNAIPEGSPLSTLDLETFRRHWRDKGTKYLTDKALNGIRRKQQQQDKKDTDTLEEEEEVQAKKPAAKKRKSTPTTKASVTSTTTTSTVAKKMSDDEYEWIPKNFLIPFEANGRRRIFCVVDIPDSINGDNYDVKIEKNGKELVVREPTDLLFTKSDYLRDYLKSYYNVDYRDDSTFTTGFDKAAKDLQGKRATFRCSLPFACESEFSMDTGFPGIDIANFSMKSDRTGEYLAKTLMVALRSVERQEQTPTKHKIKVKTFTSASPKKKENISIAQLLLAFQELDDANKSEMEVEHFIYQNGFHQNDQKIDPIALYRDFKQEKKRKLNHGS